MTFNSEPYVNGVLGQALGGKHPRWEVVAEASGVFEEKALRPDVLVRLPGAQAVVIETEFDPGPGVERDALARLGATLAVSGRKIDQVVAVLLPRELRQGQTGILGRVERCRLRYAVLRETVAGAVRWPIGGWLEGGVDDLATLVGHAGVSERVVSQGADILENTVRQAAGRLREHANEAGGPGATPSRIAERLRQVEGEQTSRMAMAILANAVAFQASISHLPGVPSLADARGGMGHVLQGEVLKHWRKILDEINYWPIFSIASDILRLLPVKEAGTILDLLHAATEELSHIGALGFQGISGQMFQRLIADRKFLATFYTLPTSASLLATLGVNRLPIDWSDPDAIRGLRIADLACGTGTLLSVAYHCVRTRHVLAGGDDAEIHPVMMERSLIGADIMPAATHLTASMLSSAHPGLRFSRTKIMTCPYGEQPVRTQRRIALGALDLIEKESVASVLGVRPAQWSQSDLFGSGREELHGEGERSLDDGTTVPLPHGSGDLLIMNPPFTRPTNHEVSEVPVPSFAGFATAKQEQKAMSKRLKEITKALSDPASHGNAGLASNFMDLAHLKIREGGVVALVLPSSFVQGASWSKARSLCEGLTER